MGLISSSTLLLLLLGLASSDNSTDTCAVLDPWDSGPWSMALEEWALSTPGHSDRQGRVMSLPPAPGYYVSDRVDRTPPPPLGPPPLAHGPQPYAEWQPPSNANGKIVNRPGAPSKDKPFKPSPVYPPPPPNQIPPQHQSYPHQPSYQQPPHYGPQQTQNQHLQSDQHQPSYQQPPHYDHQQNQNQHQPSHQQPPHYGPQQNQYQQSDPHRGPGLAAPPHPSSPPHPSPVDRVDDPPRKQVTETDLYLLGAIEKLVYRVDLMEKRLRKMEENVHFLVAGVDHKPEPCVSNFTRIGGTCYHFSAEATDWKTANLNCRKLRANLIELDSDDERRRMTSAMIGDKKIRGKDVWTGGLNPGLLWIWSHSARPVLPNGNATASAGAGAANASATIVGDGRCLAFVHDPAIKTYVYRGQDCAFRHRYICEKEEDKAKLSNEIERVSRALGHVQHSARRARGGGVLSAPGWGEREGEQ